MLIAELQYIDEHAADIAAGVDRVWPTLLDTVDRALSRPGAAGYARLVGSTYCNASGPRPLAVGSTMPGFRVDSVVPRSEIVLEGRHRFSAYALILRLEPAGPDRTRLVAESRATFPRLGGRLYRLLVIGTGGHVVAVRRLLSAVRRRAGT